MKVIAIDKQTHERIVLEDDLTEAQAERFCEMWGWSYDDGKKSYWLEMEV